MSLYNPHSDNEKICLYKKDFNRFSLFTLFILFSKLLDFDKNGFI